MLPEKKNKIKSAFKIKDWPVLLLIFIFASLYTFHAGSLPDKDADVLISPVFLIMVIIGIFYLMLNIKSESMRLTEDKKLKSSYTPSGQRFKIFIRSNSRIVFFMMFLLLYLILLWIVGFNIATVIFIALAQYSLGERKISRLVSVSLISVFLLYVFMEFIFRINLPEGLIFS